MIKNNNDITQKRTSYKVINRISKYDDSFNKADLEKLNPSELINLQKRLLVDLTVKQNFRLRHKIKALNLEFLNN